MNKVKTIVNPQTGMMETVEDTSHSEDAKAKLDRTKRELREMLHGTGQIPVPELVPTKPTIDWEAVNHALDEGVPFDPSKCRCMHPNARSPCGYCEGGWEEFGDDI